MRSQTQPMLSLLSCLGLWLSHADGFLSPSLPPSISPAHKTIRVAHFDAPLRLCARENDDDDQDLGIDDALSEQSESIQVTLNATLSDARIKSLFAWIKCAFGYEPSDKNDVYAYYYNNIELAIAASFGDNLPEGSVPAKLLRMALEKEGLLDEQEEVNGGSSASSAKIKEWEELLVGDVIGRGERESASMGAMGAAQWSGRFMTRPHSLLDVRKFDSVDDWIKTLPRGCKRTLKKATPESQNFTVAEKQIKGGYIAPHSSYGHFRCVVQHEVRLLSKQYGDSTGAFVNGLAEAIGRYQGTTRMAGSIREYRDASTDKVIGFAHEVTKGRTMRGQWFYCDDDAARRYVWFHSVRDLVRRAIEDDRIDVVDLGPSGSDAFTDLKQKYGFESVVDWPSAADYSGDFIYEDDQNEGESMMDEMKRMIEQLSLGPNKN